MKKFRHLLMAFAVTLTTTVAFAQSVVTGTVVDGDYQQGLPGATVVVKGTSKGTSTDFNGKFSITTKENEGVLVISYLGFVTKEVAFSASTDLGQIILTTDAVGLAEVQVIASIAVDRKTPVAASTVRAETIDLKLGSQEFPEILKTTPGVYVTRSGGGFGDGDITMRGFNTENVAVLINGIPVNDMENGRVYWSNWSGLSDVTSFTQTQRGLGASKLAVPSIGGTQNIITKTTDVEEGGKVFTSVGNDGYQKYGFTLSTGLMDNGFAATVAASKTKGDGYVDGTEFEGYSYFLNISKELNASHRLSLTAFGAPQRHGQRQNQQTLETFAQSSSGKKFNSDWGYLNGEVVNIEDNFYHKPQISLNHYWTLSDKTSISSAAYASFGSGGGGGTRGVYKFGLGDINNPSPYRNGYLQPVNLDLIAEENIALGNQGSETVLRASRNNHRWYGILSVLKTELNDNLTLSGGLDLRSYKGTHFTELTNLLGGRYFADDNNVNNPNNLAQEGDKIAYHDDGFVLWSGLFGQAEYSKDDLSAFLNLSVSETKYKRLDYFQYLDTDPLRETDWQNFTGYSAKGGANYNLTDTHSVFGNIGYFEKAPFLRAVFLNFRNDINTDAQNEKVFSAELGYKFRGNNFSLNLNAYHTLWLDRGFVRTFQQPDGTTGFANIPGVNALHQGIELDMVFNATDKLTFNGMVSVGDWRWQDNVIGVQIFDEDQTPIGNPINLYIEDVKVGNSAQTTAAIGFTYDFLPKSKFFADYVYNGDLYADFDPTGRTSPSAPQAYQLPDFGLIDLGFRYSFDFAGLDSNITARMNNVLNTDFIPNARDNSDVNGIRVYRGVGRTFSLGAQFNF